MEGGDVFARPSYGSTERKFVLSRPLLRALHLGGFVLCQSLASDKATAC